MLSEDFKNRAGRIIKELRTKEGMRQRDLGNKVGLNHSVISSIENGGKKEGIKTYKQVFEYFGLKIELYPEIEHTNGEKFVMPKEENETEKTN